MKQCNKCGRICDDTQNFCEQCGNRLDAAPQQSYQAVNQQPIPPYQNQPQFVNQPQYVPAPQPPKKKKKWWIVIVVVLVICVIGSLASLGNSDKNENTSNKTSTSDAVSQTTEDSEDSEYITLEKFNKIETGMTYDEVKKIIGSEGELLSTSSMNDYTISIYVWYGEGMIGANANVTFTNGKVTGKAQVGLQ